MRKLAFFGSIVGVALLVAVGWRAGAPALWAALVASPAAVAAATIYRLVSLLLVTTSWGALLPPAARLRFTTLLRLRWIGESINALLPVAQVGGDVARARQLSLRGVPGAVAAASMIGDLSVGALTQVPFVVAGALVLATGPGLGVLARPLAVGVAFLSAIAAGSVVVLQLGVGPLGRALPMWTTLTRYWNGLAGGAECLDAALRALLARRRRLLLACLWHLLAWFAQAGEVWLVLALLGAPVGVGQALVIESLPAALRAATFFVPGGLGVQDAAVIELARHFGVPAQTALALAFVKRLRELAVGLPGLVVWILGQHRPVALPEASAPQS
jgi:putative membrane protein